MSQQTPADGRAPSQPDVLAGGIRLRVAASLEAPTRVMSKVTPIVFVVDHDAAIRESLALLIRRAGWQPETFGSASEFLARPRAQVPSCLVLDVPRPGLNGLDLQKQVAADRTDMPIIIITGHGDVSMSVQAMKAGAVEFLTKPFAYDVLLDAVRHALERSRTALGRETEVRALRERHASLTRREREVMELVVSGLLNKQVGGELGISEITVKAHRGRVMQKMGASSLAELVTMASKLRIGSSKAGDARSAWWSRLAPQAPRAALIEANR